MGVSELRYEIPISRAGVFFLSWTCLVFESRRWFLPPRLPVVRYGTQTSYNIMVFVPTFLICQPCQEEAKRLANLGLALASSLIGGALFSVRNLASVVSAMVTLTPYREI